MQLGDRDTSAMRSPSPLTMWRPPPSVERERANNNVNKFAPPPLLSVRREVDPPPSQLQTQIPFQPAYFRQAPPPTVAADTPALEACRSLLGLCEERLARLVREELPQFAACLAESMDAVQVEALNGRRTAAEKPPDKEAVRLAREEVVDRLAMRLPVRRLQELLRLWVPADPSDVQQVLEKLNDGSSAWGEYGAYAAAVDSLRGQLAGKLDRLGLSGSTRLSDLTTRLVGAGQWLASVQSVLQRTDFKKRALQRYVDELREAQQREGAELEKRSEGRTGKKRSKAIQMKLVPALYELLEVQEERISELTALKCGSADQVREEFSALMDAAAAAFDQFEVAATTLHEDADCDFQRCSRAKEEQLRTQQELVAARSRHHGGVVAALTVNGERQMALWEQIEELSRELKVLAEERTRIAEDFLQQREALDATEVGVRDLCEACTEHLEELSHAKKHSTQLCAIARMLQEVRTRVVKKLSGVDVVKEANAILRREATEYSTCYHAALSCARRATIVQQRRLERMRRRKAAPVESTNSAQGRPGWRGGAPQVGGNHRQGTNEARSQDVEQSLRHLSHLEEVHASKYSTVRHLLRRIGVVDSDADAAFVKEEIDVSDSDAATDGSVEACELLRPRGDSAAAAVPLPPAQTREAHRAYLDPPSGGYPQPGGMPQGGYPQQGGMQQGRYPQQGLQGGGLYSGAVTDESAAMLANMRFPFVQMANSPWQPTNLHEAMHMSAASMPPAAASRSVPRPEWIGMSPTPQRPAALSVLPRSIAATATDAKAPAALERINSSLQRVASLRSSVTSRLASGANRRPESQTPRRAISYIPASSYDL